MGFKKIGFSSIKLNKATQKNLDEVVRENWACEGPKVREFEAAWGKLFGYKHNVAVSSGTSGDTAACLALYDFNARMGEQNEIIAPALAFAAVGESIIMSGFKPVFVDIERETLNINPKKIEEKISPHTRAIMAVHTMGKPCEMDTIMDIARKHDLYVIEDSCEAHGAFYKGKLIGHWGDMAVFSCYAAHLIYCGEGGMVSTNDDAFNEVLRSVRTHGRREGKREFDHMRLGFNGKMNDLEAAVGLSQVGKFKTIFKKRHENLHYLLDKTSDLKPLAYFNTEGSNEIVCGHAFTITLKNPMYDAELLKETMKENNISYKLNFKSMPTQQGAFSFLGYKVGDFPEAEYVGNNGIHIGIHQGLTRRDLDRVSSVLHRYFDKNS